MTRLLTILLLSLCLPPAPAAEVVRVEITERGPVLGGRPFGSSGAYEKLAGEIHFAFDPENPANARVVDLEYAPRDTEGRVEARANFMVLQPVDPALGSGTALLEVSNRGSKASLGYFNRAVFTGDPEDEAHFGDGWLLRRGLTLIWVGWQFDVLPDSGRLRLQAPRASEASEPLLGWVRCDWTLDEPGERLPLGHRRHVPYAVYEPESGEHVLTVRDGRLAERRVIPRASWSFWSRDGGAPTHVASEAGFAAGSIYELVYRGAEPTVVGLGLAAVRDTMAYAVHGEDPLFPARRGVALGISQTGRFLRHFLYQGFNTDERGRPVFAGILAHTAGAGRGSFNHRFAQPSRDAHRYSAFFYPTDLFPFSGRVQRDPVTGARDGLLAAARESGHVPAVFYTNTGYEYWGRAASLLHTSLDGSADVELLPEERVYHLASAQHFAVPFPPLGGPAPGSTGGAVWRGNPLDFLVTERALLHALLEWVEDGREPPPSAYPRVDAGTLVPIDEVEFPRVPGLPFPR